MLDIENRGPTLQAGAFDAHHEHRRARQPVLERRPLVRPSFEYPRGSGIEGLKSADLWWARAGPDGVYRVSGGPLLEGARRCRPRTTCARRSAASWARKPDVDDDGDGCFDEEALNGLDDDATAEVDEDLGVSAAQKLYAEYVDDRPGALDYGYSGGEPHEALHLSVKQEVMTWSVPGYDRIAGVHFSITNHGTETLEDVRIGLFADLDVSAAGEGPAVTSTTA